MSGEDTEDTQSLSADIKLARVLINTVILCNTFSMSALSSCYICIMIHVYLG